MKVDVVMCTWNSNKRYFIKCLNSIKREVPIHCFVLIDRFSRDGTVETVRKVFPNAKIIRLNARLGVSRKRGIELVDTKFFVFVDSDIELCNGWFKQIVTHLDPKTGAIQGSLAFTREPLTAWFNWLHSIQVRFKETFKRKVIIITAENSEVLRGCTHNTLIRTCLVKDWEPPTILSAYEDHLLLRHLLRKGYKAKIILNPPAAIHHWVFNLNEWLKRSKWGAAGARIIMYRNWSTWSLIRDSLRRIVGALFASLQTKQPMILPYIILSQLGRIEGWVGWIKYLDLKR
jgi:glycosyltransferase involved in cell wall biosynthesis